MTTGRVFGLCYRHEHSVIALPLLNVRADATIKELAAQVKLTQTYANDADVPIEATYAFPIPARAAVCSFVMVKQDGTRVVGIVQEKQEARKTYETAVAAGQRASLLEQQTPDVFHISVGNIQPQEQVQIELVYATELTEDEESDSIRFHLPVHIGSRYGVAPATPPPALHSFFLSTASPATFLMLRLSVEAAAPIAKIGSPSHTISTELGPDLTLPNFKDLPISNYARISLSSDAMLDKDFILTVKSAGLDAPRCIAEPHPTHETVALGLTLVPRFKLPDVSRQEFMLLVDRSGSMRGKRIQAAVKALVVMLRAIPHKDSLFQIMSFGNRCTALWPEGSKPYNQETLEEATRHVDSMQADFGGTQIRAALSECFRFRKTDRPLSLFVLTDGDAWDVDGVLAEIRTAVEKAPQDAYVRVSVLGIGNSASTAMCEGMARVGNGVCMMVGEEESSFTGKISRLLKAAKSPPISDVTVHWGQSAPAVAVLQDEDDFEMVEAEVNEEPKAPVDLNIFDESIVDPLAVDSTPPPPPPPVVLPPPAHIQQSPFKIHNIFPNVRLNVYAILQGKTLPEIVTLRGRSSDGAEIELPIPVTVSHLPNTSGAPPAMHALAARKIIQDLEDGRHDVAQLVKKPEDADLVARTVKALVVRLGTTYSIASTHTSFVAVDESKPEAERIAQAVPAAVAQPMPQMVVGGSLKGLKKPRKAMITSASRSATTVELSERVQKGIAQPRAAAPMSRAADSSASVQGRRALLYFSASPANADSGGGWQAPESWSVGESSSTAPIPTAPSTSKMIQISSGSPRTRSKRGEVRGSQAQSTQPPPSAPAPPADTLEMLARMQAFDGQFGLYVLDVVRLGPSTDVDAVRAALPENASDAVVATLLAMAFLANKLGAEIERDAWEGLYEKAKEFVEGQLAQSEDVNALVENVVVFIL
ncbi:hypothetical protein HMN09_00183200 [Mycena chlorophos]|uniref:Uncharacterized protein n=1 Tax=Mycena chlorophos TaxID=658473 RepID=A0A8H6WQM4_MYCCL|nr:hypothetical protein HMN09_00183200 [Mycena chlorophos]